MLQASGSDAPASAGFAIRLRWSGRGLTMMCRTSQRGGEPGYLDGIVSVPSQVGHGEPGDGNPPLG